MPKQGQRAEINSFVKGLITEASELNFPADAFVEAENFELNRDGTVNRRLGMDFEVDHQLRDSHLNEINVTSAKVNTFRWLSVGGDVTKDFIVIQLGQRLFFFDSDVTPLSQGYQGEVVLSSFLENNRFSFAALEGRLVVASGADTLAVVSYPGFTVEYGRLLTRDVWGVEETLIPQYETDPSYRDVSTSVEHAYNLYNQSWGIPRKNASGDLHDITNDYRNEIGKYPSNSEQVWAGLQFQAVTTGQTPFERVYFNLYTEVIGAKPSTAKGYFIIDALRRGQSRSDQAQANKAKYPELVNNIPLIRTDLTTGGVNCITDFAGRVFYAGFNGEVVDGDSRSPEYSNYVFFSQVVKSSADFFKCYQDGDPTSRDSADIIDTDGGFLRISGAKSIVALRNLETSLIVFATNGIWSVTGGSDYGFSATNYKATKISSFGSLSESSIVVEGNSAYYWAEDGIYRIGRNELGDLGVQNLSLATIQDFYNAIDNVAKVGAVGSYDLLTKKVRWIYKTGTAFTETSVTRELVFDSNIGAFIPNKIMNTPALGTEVFSLFRSSSFSINPEGTAVIADDEEVFADTEDVFIGTEEVSSSLQSTRYLVLVKSGSMFNFSFSQYNNTGWKDWNTTDAKAYGYAGVQTAGDSAIKKQLPYLVFHMYRTETGADSEGNPIHPSGCRVRYQWNFSNNSNSKKFSTLFQVYRYVKTFIPAAGGGSFDNGFRILTTKNKVRGMGRAFQMYFETEANKDCQIVGWSLTVNGNSVT